MGGQRPCLHLTQSEARFEACDAGQTGQLLLVHAFVVGEIARQHCDEVVVLTRHQMARDDGGRGGDRLLEGLEQFLVLTFEGDLHEDRDLEPEGATADAGLIALDHARLLEGADAPGHGGWREGHAFGNLDLGEASVVE